jgi:predicted nucleic-acid-binding protein
MLSIDTNVLVRYLVADDARQARLAQKLIDGAGVDGNEVFVGSVVLAEAIWVLESSYGMRKRELVHVLEDLIGLSFLRFERPAAVVRALQAYRKGSADFPDYLSAAISLEVAGGCLHTFDRKCREAEFFVRM